MSSNSFLRRLLVLTVGAIFSITGVARAQSTAAFAPVPMASVLAGSSAALVAAGSCSTGITNPLTTYNIGDGCAPSNATIISITDVAIDSEGNVYWSDTGSTASPYYSYGNIRVLYKGGSVAANLIFGANSWNPNFTAKFASASAIQASGTGLVFSVEQGISGLITVKSGSTYSCGNAAGGTYGYLGYDSVGDGCPAGTLRGAPRAIAVDKYGNVFFIAAASTGSASNSWQPRVIFAGGGSSNPVYNLITTLNSGVTPTAGYAYSLGFQANAAGSGYVGPYGDGGLATGASLMYPRAIAVDSKENVYITDASNGSVGYGGTQGGGASGAENIREIFGSGSKIGYVTTVAGETACGGDYYDSNGNLVSLSIGESSPPSAAGVLGTGSVYFHNSTTAQSDCPTTPNGTSLTFTDAVAGNGDPAAAAPTQAGGGNYTSGGWFYYPTTIWLDAYDNLYIAENGNTRIRVVYRGGPFPSQITSTPVVGDIYTYAGGEGIATNKYAGIFANVLSNASGGGGVDGLGNIYAFDTGDSYFWKVDPSTYTVFKYAGIGGGSLAASGGYCMGGTSGPTSTDAIGTGCPGPYAKVGVGYSASAGPAKIVGDNAGNQYVVQEVGTGYGIVQKLSLNNQFTATADGSTTKQYVAFEEVYNPLAASSSVTGVALSAITFGLQGSTTDTEFSLDTAANTSTCTATSSPSFQGICAEYVDFTPTHPGQRSAAINFAGTSSASGSSVSVSATGALVGVGTAADIAINTETCSTLGTGLEPTGVAADLNGNVYVADSTGNQVLKGASSGTTLSALTTPVTGLSSPSQVAVDNAGNIYVADTGNNRVLVTNSTGATIVSVTGSSTGTALSGPKGVAVDPYGNIYVADTGNNRIVHLTYAYQTGSSSYLSFIATVPLFTSSGTAVTLSSPTQLAFDASGDLFIVDSGNSRIVEVPSVSNGGPSNTSVVTLDSGVVPEGIALDAAGDLYVADSAGNVLEYYLGATPGTAVLTGLSTPVGLALDADAQIFVADSQATGLTVNRRSTGYASFTASGTQNLTLNNVGNAALTLTSTTGSVSGTNASAFGVAAASSGGCTTSALAAGGNCLETATFTAAGIGTYTANAAFTSNAADSASIRLSAYISNQPTVAISPSSASITEVQSLSLTITVSGALATPTGTVTLSGGGYTSSAATLSGGTATIVIPAGSLTVGLSTLTATYTPDTNSSSTYITATGTSSVNVTLLTQPTVTISSLPTSITTLQSLSVSITVSGTLTTPNGTVTLSGGGYTSAATTLTSGSATIVIPAGSLNAGSDSLTASYSGNTTYASASSTPATVAVTKVTPISVAVTPAASSITTVQTLSVTIAVSVGSGNPAATGTVTLTSGSYTSAATTLTSGSAIIVIPAGTLAVNSDTLSASYSGDGNYANATSSSTTTVTVTKVTPTSVAVTPASSSITTVQTLSVTVAVSVGSGNPAATGTVTLTSGSYTSAATTLTSGSATIVISAGSLAAGSDSLTASYSGDSNYASTSSSSTTVTVTKATTTVTVTPASSSITTAQTLSVTIAVSGTPSATGTVTLTSGSYTSAATTLTSGSATIVIPAGDLAVSSDTLTANYSGDGNYLTATGQSSVSVTNPALKNPVLTVTPTSNSITTVQSLNVNVAISGGTGNPTPTGSVTLTSGSYTSAAVTLTSGAAVIPVSAGSLAVGSDVLTVSYTADATSSSIYNSASATSSAVTVTKTSPTSVTVTPASSSITTVQTLSVTVAVSGTPTATGTVTLTSGSYTSAATTLTSGSATIVISADSLAVGSDTLSASYSGDGNYTSATSNPATVTVTKASPTVTVTPASSSITTVQTLSVTVAVSGTPTATGTVTLTSGSYTSAATTLTSGSSTIVIPAGSLAAGSNSLTASYTPDTASSTTYASASSNPATVTVTKVTPTSVTVTPASSSITTVQSLSVTIAISGTPTPTGTVTLAGGGYTSAATTLTSGSATIVIPANSLTTGTDTLSTTYSGDGNYTPQTGTASIVVAAPFSLNPVTGGGTSATVSAPGASTTYNLSVGCTAGFTGSISLTPSITSSPAGAQDLPTLSFGATSPVVISATAGCPQSATLTVLTTAASSGAVTHPTESTGRWYAAGAAALGCMLLLGFRKRRSKWAALLGVVVFFALLAGGLTGCGGSSSTKTTNPGTTVGAYTITITGASGTTVTTPLTITLNVQ